MSFKHRPFRRVEGYSVSCLGCFQCVILSTIKKRMNQLLLPRDYSAILELIIVFTAFIFLTGNVLAFVENCSHCISLGCEQTHVRIRGKFWPGWPKFLQVSFFLFCCYHFLREVILYDFSVVRIFWLAIMHRLMHAAKLRFFIKKTNLIGDRSTLHFMFSDSQLSILY